MEPLAATADAVALSPVVPASSPVRLRWKDAGASNRTRFEIHAYIGMNGSGKSLAMVHDTLPSLREGRTVLSTVPLVNAATGELWPNYVPFTEWPQLLELTHGDVLMDEILGVASSRASQSMPPQVALLLNKLRKSDVALRWTAPAWNRCDVTLREVTKAVTVCRGYWGKRAPAGEDGIRPRWRQNRLFRFRTYAAEDFATWTDAKEGKLNSIGKSWMRGPGSEAFASYDTLGAVSRVGEVLESGRCAHCGGIRRAPVCKCDR